MVLSIIHYKKYLDISYKVGCINTSEYLSIVHYKKYLDISYKVECIKVLNIYFLIK